MMYVTIKDVCNSLTGQTLPTGSCVKLLWENPETHQVSVYSSDMFAVFIANKEDLEEYNE